MYKKSYINEQEIEAVIEELNSFIVALARRKILGFGVHPAMAQMEVDEIAQRTRIKLWFALKAGNINNPRGYARAIVSSEFIDMQRRAKRLIPLSPIMDECCRDEETTDPARNIEQIEALRSCVMHALQAIQQLPPCQQQAIICILKDAHEDTAPLLTALQGNGINVRTVQWPQDRAALQSTRSSLSISRKKLRKAFQERDCS